MDTEPKSILIFGASSPTGQLIVQEALNNNWSIKIYGRRTLPKHAENPLITTSEGALDDVDKLRQAIKGTTVIVSVLGPSGTKIKNSPFPSFYRRVFELIREEGVERIIALSTFSVTHPNDRFSLACRLLVGMLWLFGNSAWRNLVDVGRTFDEHAGGLDWTLFRVGFLKDQGPGRIVQGYVGDGKVGLGVNRVDLARWVVEQAGLEMAEHVGDKPCISSA
ncbi:NAD(P)-binding protein [Aspergillus karnatakaensis]|uniref:NAD(P)-binding oxidoreductase n=1 Tax=Aspergillus karnatakaensis TaxID=1810916 RepID=UPI003CCD31A8